jgi:hypothetical protein
MKTKLCTSLLFAFLVGSAFLFRPAAAAAG